MEEDAACPTLAKRRHCLVHPPVQPHEVAAGAERQPVEVDRGRSGRPARAHASILAGQNARVDTSTGQIDRLRVLVDAGIALSSELSLDALLQRIVETAAELTGARYAALGVIDASGNALERFLTTGVDEETRAAIGDPPRGRGILGVLIREAQPLRLHDLTEDPRSVGFPQNHPPMKTFLGVPILLRGVAYGNLYLTEKERQEDFTAEDEELTQLLAAQAAVAIENARLYESSTRWLRQLESLNEIADALVSELELEPLLALIAGRMRELVDARLVLIALPDGGESLRVAAAEGEEHVRHRRHAPRLRPLQGGPGARAGAQRARGLRARGSGDRPAGGTAARSPLGALRPARRAGATRSASSSRTTRPARTRRSPTTTSGSSRAWERAPRRRSACRSG